MVEGVTTLSHTHMVIDKNFPLDTTKMGQMSNVATELESFISVCDNVGGCSAEREVCI